MKKKLIFITNLIVLLNIFLYPLLSVPKTTFAGDFTNDTVSISSSTTINHIFAINGNNHSVVYQLDSSLGGVEDHTSFKAGYYKMQSSDYFSVPTRFYLQIYSTTTGPNDGVYTPYTVYPAYTVYEEISQNTYNVEQAPGFDGVTINTTTINHRYFRVVKNYSSTSDYWTMFSHDETDVTQYAKDYIDHISSSDFQPAYKSLSDSLSSYFAGGRTFNVSIKDNGDSAPTIVISGNSNLKRPELTFKFTGVGEWGGFLASANNNFYFTYVSQNNANDGVFSNLAIKVSQDGSAQFVYRTSADQKNDVTLVDDNNEPVATVKIDQGSWLNIIINKVFNTGSDCTSPTLTLYNKTAQPPYTSTDNLDVDCININSDGWLAKWGIKVTSETLLGGVTSPSYCSTVGGGSVFTNFMGTLVSVFCNLGAVIHNFASSFVAGAVDAFNQVVGFDSSKY